MMEEISILTSGRAFTSAMLLFIAVLDIHN